MAADADAITNRWCECCQTEVPFESIVRIYVPGGITRALPICRKCWKLMTKYERADLAYKARIGDLLQNIATLAYKGGMRIWGTESESGSP